MPGSTASARRRIQRTPSGMTDPSGRRVMRRGAWPPPTRVHKGWYQWVSDGSIRVMSLTPARRRRAATLMPALPLPTTATRWRPETGASVGDEVAAKAVLLSHWPVCRGAVPGGGQAACSCEPAATGRPARAQAPVPPVTEQASMPWEFIQSAAVLLSAVHRDMPGRVLGTLPHVDHERVVGPGRRERFLCHFTSHVVASSITPGGILRPRLRLSNLGRQRPPGVFAPEVKSGSGVRVAVRVRSEGADEFVEALVAGVFLGDLMWRLPVRLGEGPCGETPDTVVARPVREVSGTREGAMCGSARTGRSTERARARSLPRTADAPRCAHPPECSRRGGVGGTASAPISLSVAHMLQGCAEGASGQGRSASSASGRLSRICPDVVQPAARTAPTGRRGTGRPRVV